LNLDAQQNKKAVDIDSKRRGQKQQRLSSFLMEGSK
jgi:hypothetical protein